MTTPRPFAQVVDSIRRDLGLTREVPDFDSQNGNESGRFLLVLEAPGPKAIKTGHVSIDNPDVTARNLRAQLESAGVNRRDIAIWNVVPWYLGNADQSRIRPAQGTDVAGGAAYLLRVVELMPNLQCIVLVGGAARRAHILLSARTTVRILSCHHPSPKVMNANPSAADENIAVFSFMLGPR